jgi:ADP-heptose:LPS heptosyltransferase
MHSTTPAVPSGASGDPDRVLVFRCGQLGDMVLSLPAIWAARRRWPKAAFSLLCDVHPGKNLVGGPDIFRGMDLFESFESYDAAKSGGSNLLRTGSSRLRLLLRLRARRYDVLVYLAPSVRRPRQVWRDVRFFRAAGLRRIFGARHFPPVPIKRPGQPFPSGESEADLLLARLAADGIPVPGPGRGSLDLRLGDREAAEMARWKATLASDGGRAWLGIGPGSKMPAKRWPLDRFAEAVRLLAARHGLWPVVFGGAEDRTQGDRLLAVWRRGYNAAGALSVRASALALKNCVLYLGNDTGTMHLAAAAGTPCAAVFSARDWPGAWYPYGVPHRVFRAAIECEGCYLVECLDRRNECLERISVEQVLAGCEDLLKQIRFASPCGPACHSHPINQ